MGKEGLSAPERIAPHHDVSGFSCGEAVLDDWLRQRALKNEHARASRSYVVCVGKTVAAYYSLAAGSIEHAFVPSGIRRDMPRPIPVLILARLAVDARYAGKSIGTALVRDALARTFKVAEEIGVRALLVHARNENPAHFYKRLGFTVSPMDPLVLMLPLKLAGKALQE